MPARFWPLFDSVRYYNSAAGNHVSSQLLHDVHLIWLDDSHCSAPLQKHIVGGCQSVIPVRRRRGDSCMLPPAQTPQPLLRGSTAAGRFQLSSSIIIKQQHARDHRSESCAPRATHRKWMEATSTSTRDHRPESSHADTNGDIAQGAAVTRPRQSKLYTSSSSAPAPAPVSLPIRAAARKESQPEDDHDGSPLVTSPVTSPPYWIHSHSRSFSNVSVESMRAGGITLQDNTDDHEDTKNKACWAKSVYIEDHVVINGSRTGIGSFVVWNITVETLHGGSMRIRKRYSEFDELHERLLQTFPNSTAAMPPLPSKSVISKFRPKFLEHRRAGLQYFLK